MSINCGQLKDIIIKPTLSGIGLLSEDAVALLLGTAAQETALGSFISQVGLPVGRGAFGIYQMEQRPYNELWLTFIEQSKSMKAKVLLITGYTGKPPASRMTSDLVLATIMARLYYARILRPLPSRNDVRAMGEYYKKYYNTYDGKATVDQFVENYKKYVS